MNIPKEERVRIHDRASALQALERLEWIAEDGNRKTRRWMLQFNNGGNGFVQFASDTADRVDPALELVSLILDKCIAEGIERASETLTRFAMYGSGARGSLAGDVRIARDYAHALSWIVRPERKVPDHNKLERVWSEDDALTEDRELVDAAFERLTGKAFYKREALATEDAGDAEYFLMPGEWVVCCSMPGMSAIYRERAPTIVEALGVEPQMQLAPSSDDDPGPAF